mmetsp:Transcript_72978/g.157803  ORF Transcript_72978/g.157803 Transcript_72978/m.157803 type:complete len:310 (-) Transcript_72978:1340-2269(-)
MAFTTLITIFDCASEVLKEVASCGKPTKLSVMRLKPSMRSKTSFSSLSSSMTSARGAIFFSHSSACAFSCSWTFFSSLMRCASRISCCFALIFSGFFSSSFLSLPLPLSSLSSFMMMGGWSLFEPVSDFEYWLRARRPSWRLFSSNFRRYSMSLSVSLPPLDLEYSSIFFCAALFSIFSSSFTRSRYASEFQPCTVCSVSSISCSSASTSVTLPISSLSPCMVVRNSDSTAISSGAPLGFSLPGSAGGLRSGISSRAFMPMGKKASFEPHSFQVDSSSARTKSLSPKTACSTLPLPLIPFSTRKWKTWR